MKWDPNVIGRRFKVYVPKQVPELAWEIDILEELEKRVYAVLEQQLIPIRPDDPYVAFAKRVWERAVKFEYETFQLEKTSLLNEFTLRGLDLYTLALIQVEAEAMAELKRLRLLPPAWNYDNLIGSIYALELGAYDNRL